MNITSITPKQLQDAFQADQSLELIDVRTPIEFREVHVSFAQNVPLDAMNPQEFTARGKDFGKPLYVICRSGGRGKQACEKLIVAGHSSVINVEGGTQGWEQAGFPVVRGKKAVSLERQVRIAAGSLVLLGVLLGIFIHPYWTGVSGFVGAGLVFAGITDTCGMGMVLAKMPWNRVPASSSNNSVTGSCHV